MKVYEGHINTSFENEEEMIRRIKSVWKECASNLRDHQRFVF